MKDKLRNLIREYGEFINQYDCKPIENIYYILVSIKWIWG